MDSNDALLGLLRIDSYHFALASSVIQKVISRPELTILPGLGPLATGTFQFGDLTVPVFDIQSLLSGVPALPKARSLVAILRHHDATFGIELDGIHKVASPQSSKSSQLTAPLGLDGKPTLFSRSIWDPELATAVSVLDPDVLFATPEIRLLRDRVQTDQNEGRGTEVLGVALFQVHGRCFGVEVQYVREAVNPERIVPVDLGTSLLYGHIRVEDNQIPVLRLLDYLNIASQGGDPNPRRALLIGTPPGEAAEVEKLLGFVIETVFGVVSVNTSVIHNLHGSGMLRSNMYKGIFSTPAVGDVLLLDAEALLRESGAGRRSIRENAEAVDGSSEKLTFVLYRVGRLSLASALGDLEAITPLGNYLALGQPGETFLGTMEWQSHRINLLDVSSFLPDSPCDADSQRNVLILKSDTSTGSLYYGFVVNHVESLVAAALEPAMTFLRLAVNKNLDASSYRQTTETIVARTNGAPQHHSVLDLKRLAAVAAETAEAA